MREASALINSVVIWTFVRNSGFYLPRCDLVSVDLQGTGGRLLQEDEGREAAVSLGC